MAYRGTQPGSMYIRVGCGDRSVQPRPLETGERCYVDQIEMDERCRCLDGFFDTGCGFADRLPCRGRDGVLQDGRRAAGLHRSDPAGGSAGGAGCAADLPGRSGCCAARRLYPRDPLWCAARRLYPCVALRRMIGKVVFRRDPAQTKIQARQRSIEPSRLVAQAPAVSLSGKRRGKVSLTRVPPAPEESSSSIPQRVARLRMLRKPRAAFLSVAAAPSGVSANPLPSSSTLMRPEGRPEASASVSIVTVMQRAPACLTALVRASSNNRTIWITCHGRSSG